MKPSLRVVSPELLTDRIWADLAISILASR
jgi:hypothetical protein